MDRVKGVAKQGWHPKDRSFKQMLGREKNPQSQAQDHISRPLATLKDPDSFGPPPKNVNYHGGAAVPNAITPDPRGIGAPLSREEIRAKEEAERREDEAARKPAPPPVPFRVDTSGLKTNNLPKPPVRRLGEEDQPPLSPARPATKPKPSLPPRLPPRQGSTPVANSPSPPPPYSALSDAACAQDGHLNQGAAGRLGAAGISVPGFGIGNSTHTTQENGAATTSPTSNQNSGTTSAQLSELQSRFSKFSTKGQDAGPPTQGTSLAEKQAAMKTAQSFRNDPSSVSLSDARNTAATANNFRERHGDQVSAGLKSANALNKKYDIGNRLNSYASQDDTSSPAGAQQNPPSPATSSATPLPLHKRAPPPPPQKPSFSGRSTTSPPPEILRKRTPESCGTITMTAQQKDFDLALPTKWFTKEPPAFPLPSMKALGPCTSTYNWSWEQDFTDTTKILICAVRWTDSKAVTKVRVTWKRSNPLGTVTAEQRHYPAPAPLTAEELDAAHKLYGNNIADWVEGAVGTTVGDGECWTLIHRALIDLADTYRQYGKEPPFVSQGRSHGYPILTLTAPAAGSNSGLLQLADVRRGDIVQLKSAHFHIVTEEAPRKVEGQWGKWQKGSGEKNIRLNHHTAVVVRVEGDVVRVVEQNGTVPGGVGVERQKHKMASLLFAGGILAYEKVQEKRAKKVAARKAHNAARFSELEAENAAAREKKSCSCGGSEGWAGCPVHDPALLASEKRGTAASRRDIRHDDDERERIDQTPGRRRGGGEGDMFATTTTTGGTGESSSPGHDSHRSPAGFGTRREEEEDEGPLVIPDVSGVMPKYREEEVKRRGFKRRVLGKKNKEEGL
ncbi:MAG: hypothetical protein LQ338_007616 [Usnochroma carphineum]|nr:MAG: hypothetical protein LQ338_007616 [Usnochroma carphineum]